MTAERIIDARSEEYVERYCALDPLTATYLGVAGHDHELPDLTPSGFEAREELTRSAYSAVEAATPADEREQVARDAFLERLGLDLEIVDAGYARSQMNVIESALHELRMVFDLMPTEGEQAWSDIEARLAGIPDALEGYRTTLRGGGGRSGGRSAAVRRGGRPGAQLDRPAGSRRRLLRRPGRRALRTTLREPAHRCRGRSLCGVRGVRPLPRDRARTSRPRAEAVGRERYALESRRFLGATDRPRGDLRLGLGGAEAAQRRHGRDRGPDPPGRDGGRGGRAPRRRPGHRIVGKEAFRDWMQELADRTIAELDGVHFDIPERDPPDRVLPRADQRRRHLLHRPVRGLHPARPDVVGGPRRQTSSAVARGDHGLPRGRARAITSRSARPPSAATC